MNFIQVCSTEELPNDSQKVVNMGKRKIALFHYNNKISAIANACLHKAGPLGLGAVSYKYDGMYVTCPWHGWQYNVTTGRHCLNARIEHTTFPVKLEEDGVFVELP